MKESAAIWEQRLKASFCLISRPASWAHLISTSFLEFCAWGFVHCRSGPCWLLKLFHRPSLVWLRCSGLVFKLLFSWLVLLNWFEALLSTGFIMWPVDSESGALSNKRGRIWSVCLLVLPGCWNSWGMETSLKWGSYQTFLKELILQTSGYRKGRRENLKVWQAIFLRFSRGMSIKYKQCKLFLIQIIIWTPSA